MPAPHPSASVRRRTALLAQAALVGLAVWLAAMGVFHRYAPGDWTQPHWLAGDPLEVYARVRIASEQPAQALASFTRIERLGAPVGADWSGYPVPDKLVFVLTGLLARGTGLIAAVQLAEVALLALNAVAFFLTVRWLRWRVEWAAALALAFAFCSYNLRWGITLSLGQTFTLPPLILLCAWTARRAPPRGSSCGWLLLAAGLGIWLGLGNPYLAYFAGIVAGGALLPALRRRSPAARLRPLLVFLGVLCLAFAEANAAYAWRRWHGDAGGVLVRSLDDFRVYALHPLDWLVPPADHRWEPAARLGRAWFAARHASGEFFYNYLGVAGLLGLLLLLGRGLRAVRSRAARFPDALAGWGWLLVFGVAGGLNTWLAAAGGDVFRAGTRIGIFAVAWALLALGGALTRRARRWPRAVSLTLAAAVAVGAVWEQTPDLAATAERAANAQRWAATAALTAGLEKTLGPGAALFQLPAVPFPEAGRTLAMPDYEHLLPFLASDTLRFSYGFLRDSPGDKWARYLGGQPLPLLVAALERAGFSGLWLDTRGLAEHGDALAAGVAALGREELPVPAGLPVRIFRLHPAGPPVAPDFSDPRLGEPWTGRPAPAGQPQLFALTGWYGPEQDGPRTWRWARKAARTGLWWDGAAGAAQLTFRAGGAAAGNLTLRLNGREIWHDRIASGPPAEHTIGLALQPGPGVFEWEFDGPAARPKGADRRVLGFVVENLSVSAP